METKEQDFFRRNPEGTIIVALDDRKDGLLFGAVELRNGEEMWLDYELEFSQDGSMAALFQGGEDTPALEYHARGRRLDTITPPDRLLVFWNHGQRSLSVDGEPLSPGEITASAPREAAPWLIRFPNWLLEWERRPGPFCG